MNHESLSTFDALSAATMLLTRIPEEHQFELKEDSNGNWSSTWEHLYAFQSLLESANHRRQGRANFDYASAKETHPIIAAAPDALQQTIQHLRKPEISAAVNAYVAKLKAKEHINPTETIALALVESGELIPKLEDMLAIAQEMNARLRQDTGTWASEAPRGIQPRPQGPLKIG